jgi:hypothetical protein
VPGAVTYREPRVAEAINERFVRVQVNLSEETAQPIVERYRQVWSPDLRVLGSDGFELYRWNGFLPPFEFLPQLLVAEAQACLRRRQAAGAAAFYEDVLRHFPTSGVAPEAQYLPGRLEVQDELPGQRPARRLAPAEAEVCKRVGTARAGAMTPGTAEANGRLM